jgi:hypothetical protein
MAFQAATLACIVAALPSIVSRTADCATGPTNVEPFAQEFRTAYTTDNGLPSNDVRALLCTKNGQVIAATTNGVVRLENGKWVVLPSLGIRTAADVIQMIEDSTGDWRIATTSELIHVSRPGGAMSTTTVAVPGTVNQIAVGKDDTVYVATGKSLLMKKAKEGALSPVEGLERVVGGTVPIRCVAASRQGEIAVGTDAGLYVRTGEGAWLQLFPAGENGRWAPRSVRSVTFDTENRLWFASQEGVGVCQNRWDQWRLFSGANGLPYDSFTCVSSGEDGSVWVGTTRGALRWDGKDWSYRAGLRWLTNDEVRALSVRGSGDAWIATAGGISLIERRTMTFAEKARLFEQMTETRHNRYGYVAGCALKRAGDLSSWEPSDSDNDGLWTGMYGAGECFRWAATHDPEAKHRARRSFEALKFLSDVTGMPGFPARSILPTSGRDPNAGHSEQSDRNDRRGDPLWKVIHPRWPKNATGEWYWKCDTSSDEIDGHIFFYAVYYDLVADTPEEKERVKKVACSIVDHIMERGWYLVDYDGKPTRWGVWAPEKLNSDPLWWHERGLNSLEILSFLKVAEHMTGDPKYAAAADELIEKHSYDTNMICQKITFPPDDINDSDDEMAFMCFYNLVKYEKDPKRLWKYLTGLTTSWEFERGERNPLFNFMYGALAQGRQFDREQAFDTLKRIPIDLIDWRMQNSYRKDLPFRIYGATRPTAPNSTRGDTLPIDERCFLRWNGNPYQLDGGGPGHSEDDGTLFLLPYYMGLYYKFIE